MIHMISNTSEPKLKMGMNLGLFFVFISFSAFFSHALPIDPRGDIDYWCSNTPHPEPCKFFMGGRRRFVPKGRAGFRRMAVEVAMDQALHAQVHTNELRRLCRSKHEMTAWMDCSKLISNTVLQLNKTLQGLQNKAINCSDFDVQTWLSAAMTYLEICRAGSVDLNVSDFISPIVSTNVSELISNGLSITGVLLDEEEAKGEFPSWVSDGERKLLESPSLASQASIVVAKDGSGNFGSIQAAINYGVSKRNGNGRIIIRVKVGVYSENIEISNNMNNVTLVGDGLRNTIITGSRSVKAGFTTYSSATVGVDGVGFIARGITFRNTAGPQNGQAVALRSASDLSVFYACGFEGYQDTIFAVAQRQFFKSCYIYGTVDFIFGNAAVVFQNCDIYVRKPVLGQVNVITAQGRNDPFQNTGTSIQTCRVLAAPDLAAAIRSFDTFLGRPWQVYSRTVFLETYLGGLVNPAGWLAWDNSNSGLDTLYYGEYKNFGPAASIRSRVKWPGYHVITSANVASRFTVTNFIAGGAWLPATGVPFTAGL